MQAEDKNGDVPVVYVYRSDASGFTSVDKVPGFSIPVRSSVGVDHLRFVQLKLSLLCCAITVVLTKLLFQIFNAGNCYCVKRKPFENS